MPLVNARAKAQGMAAAASVAPRGALASWILGERDGLVLASRSPRRLEILERLGVPARVVAVTVDESFPAAAPIEEAVCHVATRKADAARVAGAVGLVLAADTAVVVDGRALGKPHDAAEARAMLGALSGRSHTVVTGLALLDEMGRLARGFAATEVTFRAITSGEIAAYVATGEPLDKAGAYGIQGLGALLVREIRGDYTNVVGLPVARLVDLARGLRAPEGSAR
jgi:septum formation protein